MKFKCGVILMLFFLNFRREILKFSANKDGMADDPFFILDFQRGIDNDSLCKV